MRSWILLFLFVVVGTNVSAQNEERLRVSVRDGDVQLESLETDLSAQQLDALESYVKRRISRSPFDRGGSLEIVLKEQTLNLLRAELRGIDLSDQDQVDEALDRVWGELEKVGKSQHEGEGAPKIVVGQEFEIQKDEKVEDLVVVGSSGIVFGRVKNLVAIGSDVRLEKTAQVTETLVVVGSQMELVPGARISGEEVRVSFPADWSEWGDWWRTWGQPLEIGAAARILGSFLSWLAFLVAGGFYLYLCPIFSQGAADLLEQNKAASFGWGVIGYLSIVPTTVILVLTLIGILFIPLFYFLIGLFVALGYLTLGIVIGRRLNLKVKHANIVGLALGLLIIKIVGWLPWLGGLAVAVAVTAGFGAILRYGAARIHQRRAPVTVG